MGVRVKSKRVSAGPDDICSGYLFKINSGYSLNSEPILLSRARLFKKSLFERAPSRLMTRVKDAQVKVALKVDAVVNPLRGKDYIQRLFYAQPADVVVKVKIPGDPGISERVPVTYQ